MQKRNTITPINKIVLDNNVLDLIKRPPEVLVKNVLFNNKYYRRYEANYFSTKCKLFNTE